MSESLLIAELLNKISELIDNNKASEASGMLSRFVNEHPQMADERFSAEVNMIMKQMEYKAAVEDWSYFYSIKLVYEYCKKQYSDPMEDLTDEGSLLPDRDTIWWCWLQGLDNAPKVIQKCYASLSKIGRRVVVLTEDNINEYVKMPEHIMEKLDKGIITRTHFSDLLRIELLTTRGGTWIDSTVFCSDEKGINNILSNTDVFAYSFAMRDSVSRYMMFDSWLMYAAKKSKMLEALKNMLYRYWENENKLLHYFLFHIFFTIAAEMYPEECAGIPVFSIEPCHILQHEMFNEYDDTRWEQIKSMTGIHKLTYKVEKYGDLINKKNTYWDRIITDKLP